MILWTDIETTGLNPNSNHVIEIALVATDDDLNRIGSDFTMTIRPPDSALRALKGDHPSPQIDPYVIKMHQDNGLTEELEAGGDAHGDVYVQRLSYTVAKAVDWMAGVGVITDAGRTFPPLGGLSVHFDRMFIGQHLPSLLKYINHRNYDVRSLIMMFRGVLGFSDVERYPLVEASTHRALEDIHATIQSARQIVSYIEERQREA